MVRPDGGVVTALALSFSVSDRRPLHGGRIYLGGGRGPPGWSVRPKPGAAGERRHFDGHRHAPLQIRPEVLALSIQSGDWLHVPRARRSQLKDQLGFYSTILTTAIALISLIVLAGQN